MFPYNSIVDLPYFQSFVSDLSGTKAMQIIILPQ